MRTDLQPTEHCKSMVVSGSHWNLLICYDIVLYTVWNTDSFPLYGFWSLNLFLCLCLFAQIWPLSLRMATSTTRRERKRKPRKHCRSIRVIYIHFFIMKYFKNKLNTWKETSPANLDGLGVQGHRSKKIQMALFNDLYVFCHQESDSEWKFPFFPQVIKWVDDQITSGLKF